MKSLGRFLMTFTALVIASLTFVLVGVLGQLIWYSTMFSTSIYDNIITRYIVVLMLGLPFFPETPWEIVFINSMVWGVWASLAYAWILRRGFRHRICWLRLTILYLWTVVLAAIFVQYAQSKFITADQASLGVIVIWFFTGLFIVRDWVVRP